MTSESQTHAGSPPQDEATRRAKVVDLRDKVRTGRYDPDIRRLALELIMDDREPLVGSAAPGS